MMALTSEGPELKIIVIRANRTLSFLILKTFPDTPYPKSSSMI
ncbi:hypothetical protein NARC_10235 [Candidatus Nitrosocosmicus arcticus]|uniref:Uncharacterized protein n=1 Tax=Candidatus Nitrosocosmicus arcticus TaxID=2035267 RepID=A0A557SYZ7_9ARCH|nr:hypothetical protein NARC_10235 [Candidatus Nitrosocosmicus arcticus]